MEKVKIETEFIKLDQFMKWQGICYSGSEAKELIVGGQMKVNGSIETQRGKKLRPGDRIEFGTQVYEII